jgi:hypothetical protein
LRRQGGRGWRRGWRRSRRKECSGLHFDTAQAEVVCQCEQLTLYDCLTPGCRILERLRRDDYERDEDVDDQLELVRVVGDNHRRIVGLHLLQLGLIEQGLGSD